MKNLVNKVATVFEVGFGNLPSLQRVLKQIDVEVRVARTELDILNAEYLIIPGVGSFKSAMNYLRMHNYESIIQSRCLERKLPTLGICLGAQIMLESGNEGGLNQGLGIFEGSIESLSVAAGVVSTHTGWDKVSVTNQFFGLKKNTEIDVFFNHDYVFLPKNSDEVYGTCNYGSEFAVALHKFRTFAVQFHPEKSQLVGLNMLKKFLDIDYV